MAFDDRDTSAARSGNKAGSAERIEIQRNRALPGVEVEIVVTSLDDGQTVIKRVPAATLDANWDASAKTLKAWALLMIDNAE